jgi:hypothetical protein
MQSIETTRKIGQRVAGLLVTIVCCSPAVGQINSDCTVSVLNRTVQAHADGSWVLPGVPANIGQVRARATCVRNGVTTSGQSDFFTPPSNDIVQFINISFGTSAPVPGVLKVTTPNNTLNSVGATAQLTVTSTFADGTSGDLSTRKSGTNYTTSNPAVATISPDGLVTAVSSGSVVISAVNEGALGVIAINVVLGGASHGGIPDSWAIAHGLDPNDPAMPFEDPDHDGLNNLQEFQHGTDPHNPDTDGDGIPDGLEVQLGGDPLNPNDFLTLLPRALKSIQIAPPAFTIGVNSLLLEGSRQLIVTGTLIDLNATQLDLTSTRKGTNYGSSDLNVCNFGITPGQVFGGNTGTCTITVTNSGFTATAMGTVTGFTPSEISTLTVPGSVAVDVAGDFAYIAAGSNGLAVVDISDRTAPKTRGTLAGIGDAQGIRVAGQYVFIADANGFLRVANIVNPDAPSLVASLPITGNPIALAAHANLALIAAQSGGVSLVNITDPSAPVVLATFTGPASAIGVDFDKQRGLAAVAMGSAGLQLLNISNPASPQALGVLPGGNVRRVALKFPAVLLADSQRSVTAVNISDPLNPVLSSSLAGNLGGAPVDIAFFGDIAITADVSFGRAIPVVNVINPLQPQALGFWTLRSPGFSTSIAMDAAFGYVIIPGTLRIFHYREVVDPPGTPPTASIVSPVAGSTVIERQTVPVTINAADDVAVASVTLTANGQVVDTLTTPPYTFNFQVPVGASTVTLGAFAVDLAGDIGKALPVQLNIIPDPGTTVVGRVVDVSGNPLARAAVSTFGGRSSITGSDGSFSITQVPTVLGNIAVTATFVQSDGSILKGISAATAPVTLGTTQVGTITVVPVPVITSMSRKSALADTQVMFHITGTTLNGSTFSFSPASSPSITVPSSSINPTGTSATLTVSVPARVFGTFALVATNIAGNSNTTITPVNRFTTVDPSSRADTDGDGFPDAIEAEFGSDPLDPNSLPLIPKSAGETESLTFAVLNASAPPQQPAISEAESLTFALLNGTPPPGVRTGNNEAESLTFALLNGAPPPQTGTTITEAESLTFSLLNGTPPPSVTTTVTEAESLTFSLLNGAPPSPVNTAITEAESLTFSLVNGTAPSGSGSQITEAESATFSLLNGVAPATSGTQQLEIESLTFSVLNGIAPPVVSLLAEVESLTFALHNTAATSGISGGANQNVLADKHRQRRSQEMTIASKTSPKKQHHGIAPLTRLGDDKTGNNKAQTAGELQF